jgi:hypothetical protein
LGPHELWDEPWEGLPEEDAAWEWDLVDEEENGPTKIPPDGRPGWKRWYFLLSPTELYRCEGQRRQGAAIREMVQSAPLLMNNLSHEPNEKAAA